MRLRTRALLAAVFAALFLSLPGPDPDGGGPHLGYLAVRQWLLDPAASPLAAWTQGGHVPGLAVDLVQSPTSATDHDRAAYERLDDEWAAARSAEGAATVPGPAHAPQLVLAVRIGQRGVRAELARPDGGLSRLETPLPGRWSLLPGALAIALAILLQRVLPALLLAGLCGSVAVVFTALLPPALLPGLGAAALHFAGDAFLRRTLVEDFHLRITLFVVLLFATVAWTNVNGGFRGLVALLQRRVRGPVGAQFATFASGLVLLFDDYTSCLVSGTAMRPLCDRLRVSRAKLAYLVDSTAAPVAGVSVVSTWIAYEISQFRAPLSLVTRADGTPYVADDAMSVFLASLPFRSYCWFALGLVLLVIVLRRDLPPMLAVERAARRAPPPAGDGAEASAEPGRAALALAPLGLLVLGSLLLLLRGWPIEQALPIAAGLAALVAALLSRLVARLPWRTLAAAALGAGRSLAAPLAVLFLAWTLGHVTSDLGTSHFLAAAVRGWLWPAALPIALFLLAGAIAFATGSSFGTMAILLPHVVLLAADLGRSSDLPGGADLLLLLGIAAVLDGAIFGDHCSPISDTTLLSSLASGCDHVQHTATQLPYALLAMATAALFGYLPAVWLGPGAWMFALPAGFAAMAFVLRRLGGAPDG